MPRKFALIFLDPTTDHTDQFDAWLTDEFLPGVLEVPGVDYAQHFAARPQFLVFPPPPGRTAIVVELCTDVVNTRDVADRLADLVSPARLGEVVDATRVRTCLLEEFREEMQVAGLPEGFRERHPRDLLVFFLGPVAGQEAEYHEWYDRAHIRDGLTLAGFVTGQRFRTGPAILGTSLAPSEFAAIYEVYGDDLDTAIEAAKNSAGVHEHSTAADTTNMVAYALSSAAPVVRRDRARAAGSDQAR